MSARQQPRRSPCGRAAAFGAGGSSTGSWRSLGTAGGAGRRGVLVIVVVSVRSAAPGAQLATSSPSTPNLFGGPGGGISSAIVGSAIIVGIATRSLLPLGVLIADLPDRVRADAQSAGADPAVLDVMNGLPTIVVGVFVYGLLVIGHQQSGYAGAVALAIVMLPLIARGTQEVLLLVPSALREASLALGVSRWRTVLGIILPTAFGGILTGDGPRGRPRCR